MLKNKKPAFLKSASKPENWYTDDINEICFCGRSNVGKSSLINALAKEKIAITSNTPGRTQLVNFYDFLKFRLIDLPGYGYANVSKQKSYELNELIYEFIENRVNLFGVFLICDASVITDADRDMVRYFKHKFKNFYVILNKIDKIKDNELKKQLPKICQFLNIEQNNVIPISAKKNTNLNIVYKTILNIIKNK